MIHEADIDGDVWYENCVTGEPIIVLERGAAVNRGVQVRIEEELGAGDRRIYAGKVDGLSLFGRQVAFLPTRGVAE